MKTIQKCLFSFLVLVLVLGMFAGSQAQATETTAVREGQYDDRMGWGFAAGLYEVDGRIAYCCQHAKLGFSSCPVTVTTIEDARIAKALYYGWGGPKQWSGFKDKADGVVVTALAVDHYYSTPTMSEGVEYLCKGFLAFLDTQPAAPRSTVYLYITGSDSLQNLVGLPTDIPFYETGNIEIYKTGSDGKKLAGAEFTIKDSSGNKAGIITTNANGYGVSGELEFGTYTVEETKFPDGYGTSSDTTKWTVTLNADTPNGTVTINAVNTVSTGKAMIIKDTTNGGDKSGWHFTVKDSSCNKVGSYVTNSTGIITLDLAPGTYTVTETDGPYTYWVNDPQPTKTVTVVAGQTATVTFLNKWNGKAKIIKELANPEAGSLEGWPFLVKDASGSEVGTYTTNASGEIVLDLEPGTYTVTEILPENSIWECTGALTQTITVKAGQTAVVTYTNALRPGEIHIQKEDTKGEPLAGVEFLLEWSEDGVDWSPVTYTDSTVPQIGGCTTQGLVNGKLVSDQNGFVTFSGLYPTLQYRLTETVTQDGYQLLTEPVYTGALPAGSLKISLKVVNAEIFTLPQTGAKSMALLPLGIFLYLGACAGAIVFLRRKEA